MPSTPSRARRRYSTRLLLSCAALGAAGGLLAIALGLASVVTAPTAVFFYGAAVGVYLLPAMVAQALFARPGAALLTAVVTALVSAPFVPGGFAKLPLLVLFGLALELPFAVLAYREWRTGFFWIAHPVSVLLMSLVSFALLDAGRVFLWVYLTMWGVALLTAVACTGLARLVAWRLRRAGLGSTAERARLG